MALIGPSPLSADDGDGLTLAAMDTILFHSALLCPFPAFRSTVGLPCRHLLNFLVPMISISPSAVRLLHRFIHPLLIVSMP
ncbi:hypothetical protein J8273_1609 [Carpediemonas membranifera]|uniref:Uncharacterized protein n=1 Tax=Carpediemonas membranifera TaxID=201153 RepID=A0A8J6BAD6_9EUKA|nr:hypothetical protein J8273_1609 [Carpediemonas membranifera]|eukprot:KAG9396599.1 hypothetical protein J8273_1609 [Carpediemonas membranifera]